MTKKEEQTLVTILAIGFGLYIAGRAKKGKVISVSMDFILGAYADLIGNPTDLVYEGLPLHIFLARNTENYQRVKYDYNALNGRNLTYDLIARLKPLQLSEFVAELWENGEQVLTD